MSNLFDWSSAPKWAAFGATMSNGAGVWLKFKPEEDWRLGWIIPFWVNESYEEMLNCPSTVEPCSLEQRPNEQG